MRARTASGRAARPLARDIRRMRLRELLEDLESRHGPISAADMNEARKLWAD